MERSDASSARADQLSHAELVEELGRARELAAQLQEALESRVVIEQAKGVLAERLGIAVDHAFALLRGAARSQRMPIHDLAASVVMERRTPMPILVALSRESRLRAASMRDRAEAQRVELRRLAHEVELKAERIRKHAEQGPGGLAF